MPAPRTNITTLQNALSTTAEEVLAADPSRLYAEIKNTDAAISVYFGDTNAVTASNGYLLKAGEAFSFLDYTGPVWMIAASGTPTVAVVRW
jgi:hypothetical protein